MENKVKAMKSAIILSFVLLATAFLFAQSKTIQYQYDNLSRLTRVDYGDGTVIEYTYDAVGNRETHVVTAPQAATVLVQTKLFLEGPYNTGTHEMSTSLKDAGYLPTTAPYSENARSVASVPANITDWVLVQLRSSPTGTAVVSRSVFLHKDGRIVADDGATGQITLNASAGSYYLVIKHRNHLAVMSANTVALSSGSSSLYDFTTGSDKYYGASAKLLESGIYGLYTGDTDASGTVDANDRSATWNNRNSNGYYSSDCDLSGTVDANDRSVTWNNRNLSTNVPAVGGLMMIAKKKIQTSESK